MKRQFKLKVNPITIKVLERSLLATIVPAASDSGSRVHSQETIAKSSVDDEPFNVIHFRGSVTDLSPPALATGLTFSSGSYK